MQTIDLRELIDYTPSVEESIPQIEGVDSHDIEIISLLGMVVEKSNKPFANNVVSFLLDTNTLTDTQQMHVVSILDRRAIPSVGTTLSAGALYYKPASMYEWLEELNEERCELKAARPVLRSELVQMYLRDHIIHRAFAVQGGDEIKERLLQRVLHGDAAHSLKMASYHYLQAASEEDRKTFFEQVKQAVIDNPPEESDDYDVV